MAKKLITLERLEVFLDYVKGLIPTKVSQLTNDSAYITKSSLPTVNDAKITITQGGTTKGSFTLNQSGAATIALTDNNTTYSAATTSAAGLMSSADKTKLNNTNVAFGTCETEAVTAAKVVTISGNDNWALTVGAIIGMKSTYSNTASDVTLNVNGTGAKQIWYSGAVYTSTSAAICGYAARYIWYMYDGAYWVWMGKSYDANTTYSVGTASKLGTTKLYTGTGTATDGTMTQKAICERFDKVEALLTAILEDDSYLRDSSYTPINNNL